VTDYIWRELYNKEGILKESFPTPMNLGVVSKMDLVMNFNSIIWKFKEENKLSLKDSLSKVSTTPLLEEFYKDLKMTHHIKELVFDDHVKEVGETEISL
jgi:valyl-tRNA synthetase